MTFSKIFPNIQINVLEVAPAEAIDLLYARQLNIAVVAADSVAAANLSFIANEVFSDPYVLAVPKSINLSKIESIKDLEIDKQTIKAILFRRILENNSEICFKNINLLRINFLTL